MFYVLFFVGGRQSVQCLLIFQVQSVSWAKERLSVFRSKRRVGRQPENRTNVGKDMFSVSGPSFIKNRLRLNIYFIDMRSHFFVNMFVPLLPCSSKSVYIYFFAVANLFIFTRNSKPVHTYFLVVARLFIFSYL